jgi:hypothetical protein
MTPSSFAHLPSLSALGVKAVALAVAFASPVLIRPENQPLLATEARA